MASKVQQVKDACGYTHTPVLPVCGTCQHFRSDMRPVAWVVKEIEAKGSVHIFGEGTYSRVEDLPDSVRKETDMRCDRHGFAVKKMGACKTDWEPRVAAPATKD